MKLFAIATLMVLASATAALAASPGALRAVAAACGCPDCACPDCPC
jgi:hypothetical protein